MKPPPVLIGHRVNLVLVTVAQLLSRDGQGTPVPLPFADPYDVLHPDRSPLRYRIAQVKANPDVNAWLLRLAVSRESQQIVGLGNFHDAPDADGLIEIGYSVLPTYRRLGFGRDIAHTLWSFAAAQSEVHTLRASVSPGNKPSLRIIEGAGFVKVGEQDDEVDGLEYVYEISSADYLTRQGEALGAPRPTKPSPF